MNNLFKVITTAVCMLVTIGAYGYTPYTLNFSNVVSCEVKIKAKTNVDSFGYLQWLRNEKPTYVVIEAYDKKGRMLHAFGNDQGEPFESVAEAELALEHLQENSICR